MQTTLPIEFDSYYLTAPYKFQKKKERITTIPDGYSLLQTIKTGVCASDLHYYLGLKTKEKLQQRLPLVLLHEGVCLDVVRKTRVVPIASDLTSVDISYLGKENLYPKAKYMGATANGLARQYFLYPQNLLIPVSPMIEDDVATVIEPLSIVLKAIKDVDIRYYHRVAIIGDGALAYLFALMLKHYSNLAKNNITIYGLYDEKLHKFARFGKTQNVLKHFEPKENDIVLEVVGGKKIHDTLQLAFQLIVPGGTIGIMGISDDLPTVPINQIVNQGVFIKGLTRSTYEQYLHTSDFLKIPDIHKEIKDFIYPKYFKITSDSDLVKAFEKAKNLSTHGRVIIDWIY